MNPDDDDKVEYIGGPWDGVAYPPRYMLTVGSSVLPHPDGGLWGKVKYEPSPLTGDYLFMGRLS